uniref:RNA helicase n=2 Tax=Tetranychus urticae TaxID=32264 RepID=T1K7U7_TETUR
MSRTGSGKTLAFLAPLIEKLSRDSGRSCIKGVILSPTRELAMQTFKVFKELNRGTKLKAECILGGDSLEKHFTAMHTIPDLLIATPGRLLHVLVEMDMKLPDVSMLVLDECDRLFEMGFNEQMTEIIRRLPEHRQTLLFSATLPHSVVDFVKVGLHDPVLVRLDVESKLSENLTSCFVYCRDSEKIPLLLYLLRFVVKPDAMTVVFTSTRHHVEYLATLLEKASIQCTQVYNAMDQEARKANTELFRGGKIKIMVVTDLASRGIDIPFLDNVINFNFPAKPKLYVHRVGRVARAGRSGTAYSLVSTEELPYLQELYFFLGRPIKIATAQSEIEDSMIGKAPQIIIDDECDTVNKWHESYTDLQGMRKVCENATQQYIKTRAVPTTEAVKKAKELSKKQISIHPIFKVNSTTPQEEEKKADFLSSLKSYKPKATIFEIGTNKKDYAYIMKTKRDKHDKIVAKAQRNNEIQESEEKDFHDESFYLPYRANDHYSEKGLGIENSFTKDLNNAVFDISGDDQKSLNKTNATQKWDRKKKKFVGVNTNDPKKKKIKTESGVWISASYKSNLYKKWQEKSKKSQDDDDDYEEDGEMEDKSVQDAVRQRDQAISKQMMKNKRKGSGSKSVKSELKSKADLLKERMAKEKKKKFMQWRRKEKLKKKGQSK